MPSGQSSRPKGSGDVNIAGRREEQPRSSCCCLRQQALGARHVPISLTNQTTTTSTTRKILVKQAGPTSSNRATSGTHRLREAAHALLQRYGRSHAASQCHFSAPLLSLNVSACPAKRLAGPAFHRTRHAHLLASPSQPISSPPDVQNGSPPQTYEPARLRENIVPYLQSPQRCLLT